MGATSFQQTRRRARLEPPPSRSGTQGAGLATVVQAVLGALRVTLRLAADPRVPVRDKAAAAAALVYLVSPLDVIPDLVPVAGQLDDLALVLWAWRRLVQAAGADVVRDRWSGDRRALDVVLRFAGVR